MNQPKEIHEPDQGQQIEYADYDAELPIDWGDPDKVFGTESLFTNFRITERIFLVKPESVFGKLHVGEYEMELTADALYEALELVQYDADGGTQTGKVIYTIAQDMSPYVSINWDHAPIQEVQPDWPEGVEFPQGLVVAAITDPRARRLAINIEDIWRQRGGDPKYKLPKTGGRRFKNP